MMKRVKLVLFVVMFVAGIAVAAPKAKAIVTVRVLTAKVMKSPKFIGAAAGDVSRGQQLTFEEAKGDWYRVTGTVAGWIHKTNLTERQVTLSSKPGGEGNGAASRDEVELAGRGFTPQVESEYRNKNPNLDFSHVDAIEHTQIDPAELEVFVTEGKLAGGGEP